MSLEKKKGVKKLVLILTTSTLVTAIKKKAENIAITKITKDSKNSKNDKYLRTNLV